MARPFDDIRTLAAALPPPDEAARAACAEALSRAGGREALGRLADLAEHFAGVQGRAQPKVLRPIVALYAAAHEGAGGVSPKARLEALAAGGGAVSAVAREQGAGVEVFDLASDRPAPDARLRATMSERECAATMAFGMEAVAKTPDLLILGDLARGAERAAAALALALFGGEAGDWTSPEDVDWVAAAAARAAGEAGDDPLELLRQLGGRETAALAGAILAAGTQRVPVLLDGYAAMAATAAVHALAPGAVSHCLVGDAPPAAGPRRLRQRLGTAAPLLDLGAAGREGVGSAAAIGLCRAACAVAAA